MIAVIFEVTPADGRKEGDLDIAANLRRELEEIDESTIVQVVAGRDIYTAGPLEVDIAMQERVESAVGRETRWGINDRT